VNKVVIGASCSCSKSSRSQPSDQSCKSGRNLAYTGTEIALKETGASVRSGGLFPKAHQVHHPELALLAVVSLGPTCAPLPLFLDQPVLDDAIPSFHRCIPPQMQVNIYRREIPPVAVNGCSGSLYTPLRHSLSASDTRNKSWPGGTSMFLSRLGGGGRTLLELQLPVRSKPRAKPATDELRARISCIAIRWRWRSADSSTAGSSISENAGRPVPISLHAAQRLSAAFRAGDEEGSALSKARSRRASEQASLGVARGRRRDSLTRHWHRAARACAVAQM